MMIFKPVLLLKVIDDTLAVSEIRKMFLFVNSKSL